MLDTISLVEAERLLKAYGLHQVVIIGRRAGDDGYEAVCTHGTDMEHSYVAAALGHHIRFKVMEWQWENNVGVGERVRLARAAPRLLAALKETLFRATFAPEDECVETEALAAIAEAEGPGHA